MKINSLYAVNFRNYESCNLQLSSMINVFYGQNAQGKTNLLEAIFYSAFGMSHRTSAEEEMLKMGADAMAVGVEYASFSGSHERASQGALRCPECGDVFAGGPAAGQGRACIAAPLL